MRRIDDLQLKNLKIIQETDHFCFGTDAVALANFAVAHSHIKSETRIIDFCTGNGIIPLLLAGKTDCENIIGIEIQPEVAALAQQNVEFNNLQHRIQIIEGDIVGVDAHIDPLNSTKFTNNRRGDGHPSPAGDRDGRPYNAFGLPSSVGARLGAPAPHIITCNPPYKPAAAGLKTTNPIQNIARNEIKITLEQIFEKAAELLQDKGKLFMVHKPERFAEIINLGNKHKLEPRRIQMVYNSIEKPPCLILIELVKNGGRNLIIEPPQVLTE